MFKGKIILRVVILYLLFNGVVNAQTSNQVVITSSQARDNLDKIYGVDQRLVSGRAYPGEPKGSIFGNPYWIDSEWKSGSVTINGVTFTNLLLRFDITENKLVLNTSNLNKQVVQICLNINAISEFLLGERKFIRFPENDNSKKTIFCELCTEGKLTYLVTRNKSMTIASGSSTDYKYKENVGNYLLYEGRLIKFKNQQTLYKLFPEHKKEMRRFIYQNALSLNRKNSVNRTILVAYCNSLIDQS